MKTALLTLALLIACPAATHAQGGIELTTLFSFGWNYTNADGTAPASTLVQGTDGYLYGTTYSGGADDLGTVFKLTTNGAYTALVSFNGNNGAHPCGWLALTPSGNLYGTTTDGGADDLGTVFKLTPAGALTRLLSFNGTNGANPAAGLVLGTNGVLYGTTQCGGANDLDFGGDGTVFKITTNGVLTRLYSFDNGDNGGNPIAGLIQAKDGNFYGTTPYGGTDFSGSVFRITGSGALTTLYSFTGADDGSTPNAGVVQGKDGNLYGTTSAGGTNDVDFGGDGTVFKMTTAGVLTTLLSFNGTNGADPEAALVQGADSLLYGTTLDGGTNGLGTAFSITTNAAFTCLLSFNSVNGAQPDAGLVQGTDGGLYGTTPGNGPAELPPGNGTVFRLGTNGTFNTLYFFGDNNTNGATPAAGLVLGPDGNFYGTSAYGGTNHGSFGSVFKLTAEGAHTVLASFNGTNGAYPEAPLLKAADGNLYGTTAYGGTNSTALGGGGTAFKITTAGVLTTLAYFGGTNGQNPSAALAQAPDGGLYGTTENGGTNHVPNGGDGAIFRVTTNGVFTRLACFNRSNGAHPVAGLTLGPDGNFYGTTASGGTNHVGAGGDGTVFRVTTNGVLTRLLAFNVTNGAAPAAALVWATNGLLYGTTRYGGTNDLDSGGDGTLFKITTNGVFTSLYSFTGGSDGANPAAALVQGADGNLYGTTSSGGSSGSGTAFQLTLDGVFTTLYSFAGDSDGAQPAGSLLEGAPAYFYGATQLGGTNDGGTLFQLYVNPFPYITADPSDVTDFTGATATFSVAAIGAAPLHYYWQRDSSSLTDHGNIYGSATSTLTLSNLALADAAGYSVIVSNSYGAVTSAVATLTVINPFPPAVSTAAATDVGVGSATFNATVTPDGAATTAWFAWGLTTNYGSRTATTNVGSGGDAVSVALSMTTLLPFTEYHFAAVAGNALGTNTGADMSFITPGARSGVTFTPLVVFHGTNGGGPQAAMAPGPDGNFYGTTHDGGDYDSGTVFRLTTSGALTTLLSFNGTNGSHPAAALAGGGNGAFYGTTYDGGANDVDNGGDGTVFSITTNAVFASLVSFNGTNGANPAAGLAQGPDGNYYGTTESGGTNDLDNGGDGTVFRVTTNGVLKRLWSFDGTNGAGPVGGLAGGDPGSFYGTTAGGGAGDSGTIFKITTNGLFSPLYGFSGDEDGADPEAGLVQGPDGSFYGTTCGGGDDDAGTIFNVTTNGVLTTLYSFTGGLDGGAPQAGLMLGADGNFYGTTSSGGVGDYGTVFVITPGGAFATLVLFDSTLYGAGPQAGLAQAPDGSLYGSAAAGGTDDAGTLFRVRLPAGPSIVAQPADGTNFTGTTAVFTAAAVSAGPIWYRWQHSATNLTDHGNLSGSATSTLTLTNLALADAGGYSVVVSNASGMVTSVVATLTVINPFPPTVATEAASDIGINSATFNATVTPDGAPTLVWFAWGLTTSYGSSTAATNVGNGAAAVPVALNVTGLLPFTQYHVAAVAGNSMGTNLGADLSFITPGARSSVVLTPLVSFSDTNGASPRAGLAQAADGNFYGTTWEGGDYDSGTVFKLTTEGILTLLFSFDGTNGSHPAAGLVQGADSQLYGTTYDGGTEDTETAGNGTVFKITTNGLLTKLLSFDGTNGANPAAGLLLAPDGQFYGTTYAGGTNDIDTGGDGTVFKINSGGLLTPLCSFALSNGANPAAALILARDGNLYGTTENGGTNDLDSGGDGTVFRITTNGSLTTLVSFNGTNGANPVAALVEGADGCLYGTTENGGNTVSGGEGTIFRVTTNGLLTTLYSFTGGTDGANPQASLLWGTDGNLYGTTSSGGVADGGTLFQLAPDGTLTTLVLFDYDMYGANPAAALAEGADGALYGTAEAGGTNSNGTAFRLSLPPAPPVLQAWTRTSTNISLSWSAAKGQTYQLQCKSNLDAALPWLTLLSLTATNATATAGDMIDPSARRFYRVVWLR